MEARILARVLVACQTTTRIGEVYLPKSIAGVTGLVSSPLESSISHLSLCNHSVRINGDRDNPVLINLSLLSFATTPFSISFSAMGREKMACLYSR